MFVSKRQELSLKQTQCKKSCIKLFQCFVVQSHGLNESKKVAVILIDNILIFETPILYLHRLQIFLHVLHNNK